MEFALRTARGLALRPFAAEIGVTHHAVHQWEQGLSSPTSQRICGWLHDPRDWVAELALDILTLEYRAALLQARALAANPPAAAQQVTAVAPLAAAEVQA